MPRKMAALSLGTSEPAPEIKTQITDMLSPGDEKDFSESLPLSTSQPNEPEAPRRKRRSKEEMAAARGEASTPGQEIDKRYEKAKAKFAALGGGTLLKSGFAAAQKPLNSDEEEDVDDYFYMVGKKGGLDPTQNWFVMFLCALFLLIRLVTTRTDMFDKLKEVLFPEPKPEPKPENDIPKDVYL